MTKKPLTVYRQQFYFERISILGALSSIMFLFLGYVFFAWIALLLMQITPELAKSNQFAFYFFTSTLAYFLIFMYSHKNNTYLKEFFECKKKVYVKSEKILKKEASK